MSIVTLFHRTVKASNAPQAEFFRSITTKVGTGTVRRLGFLAATGAPYGQHTSWSAVSSEWGRVPSCGMRESSRLMRSMCKARHGSLAGVLRVSNVVNKIERLAVWRGRVFDSCR